MAAIDHQPKPRHHDSALQRRNAVEPGGPALWLIALWLIALWLSAASPALAVEIDGVLDPAEWAGAQHFDRFVSVQPLTGQAAPDDRRAEAYLKSTPEGIAVAIRAWHPTELAQTRSRMQRDARDALDRMNFMIDFDADGRVAYDFAITTAGDMPTTTSMSISDCSPRISRTGCCGRAGKSSAASGLIAPS